MKVLKNSVLMFLCDVFVNITQTETFLKGPMEESIYIFYLTTDAATEVQGSFSAHDFLSLLTFRIVGVVGALEEVLGEEGGGEEGYS